MHRKEDEKEDEEYAGGKTKLNMDNQHTLAHIHIQIHLISTM